MRHYVRSDLYLGRQLRAPVVLLLLLIWLTAISFCAGGPVFSYRFIVMIDPGHGGKDPGAIGIDGVHENSIILTCESC